MGVIVAFDPTKWRTTYAPVFDNVTDPMAQTYFMIATTMHANDGSGPVGDADLQLALLNMLTAHVAQLFYTPAGSVPVQLVGRIASATEGSVSVSTELPSTLPAAAAWYSQTKYGLMYWQATAQFRQMMYVPGGTTRGNVITPWAGRRW